MKTYTVATRSSRLALIQTELVVDALRKLNPDIQINIRTVETAGDQDRDSALWKLEETGFFTTQIEKAILEGIADFAVHSFKDLPTCLNAELTIAAVCQRQYAEDVLIAKKSIRSLADLPYGAKIGTSSLRRRAQIKNHRPDLETVSIRGNVETRIRKVDSGEFDAIVIARAGVERLGFSKKITQIFLPNEFIPAPAQGAIAIQCCKNDISTSKMLSSVDDRSSRITALAERDVLAIMEGGCHAPIGAYAQINNDKMDITGFISDLDGENFVKRMISGSADEWKKLTAKLAYELLESGGRKILEDLKW